MPVALTAVPVALVDAGHADTPRARSRKLALGRSVQRSTKNSLARISSIASLRKAWLELSDKKAGRSRNAIGVDGQSINQFAAKSDELLHQLSDRLRSTTPYLFEPLKPFTTKKHSGGYRVICVPTVRDRIVQKAVLNFLAEEKSGRYSLDSAVSFGFIRGKSTGKAIGAALKLRGLHPWAFKADVRSFFDAIDRDILRSQIQKRLPYRSVHPLLFAALKCEAKAETRSQARVIHNEGIRIGRGVRQGMPLSPYFANLILAPFDTAAINTGVRLVRYADDFVCFADSKTECMDIYAFCNARLGKLGLALHPLGSPGKCDIVPPDAPVEFLGVLLSRTSTGGYEPVISNMQIQERKAELQSYKDLNELLRNRLTLGKFITTIDSKISGWLDAFEFCANLSAFEDALRDVRRNTIEHVLVSGLGINTTDKRARQFLGLAPFDS